MPGIEIHNAAGFPTCDIRQEKEDSIDLQGEIISGLSSSPKSLPSLLLWDEEGLRRFDKFACSDSYYLRGKELEILRERVSEIAAVIPTGSLLVELGCGSLEKSGQLLKALEKQHKSVRYYALDVSLRGLTDSLLELMKELDDQQYVSITGLYGTYEDCVTWISGQPDLGGSTTVTFLWLGNSVSNVNRPSEAGALLERFNGACKAADIHCQFLVAADACEDIPTVQNAYDTLNPALQAFLLNGLSQSNTVLEHQAFNLEDWSCDSEFYPDQSNLECYCYPRRDVEVDVGDGRVYQIKRGERIHVISSGKWGKALMAQISFNAGFKMNHAWGDRSGVYYFYHLFAGP